MAADTFNKRASAAQMGRPFMWFLFTPDGTMDAGDRAHALHLYRGFAAGPTPPGACPTFGWAGGTGGITGGGTCAMSGWAGT